MDIFRTLLTRLPQWDSVTWVTIAVVGLIIARAAITCTASGDSRKSKLELVDSGLIALVLVFFIIRPFIVQAFYIPSGSMEPTLLGSDTGGDRILVCKWIYRFREPKRQEIVVFSAPPEADESVRNGISKDFIKRLMGLPGDIVEVRNGAVWVNGSKLEEPYIKAPPSYRMKIVNGKVYSDESNWQVGYDREIDAQPPGRIPPGKYLVLGDNRNNSNDSHKWGLLDADRLLGRAMFVFYPLNRIGLLDGLKGTTLVQNSPGPPAGSPAYAD